MSKASEYAKLHTMANQARPKMLTIASYLQFSVLEDGRCDVFLEGKEIIVNSEAAILIRNWLTENFDG